MMISKSDKRYTGIKLDKSLGQHILQDKKYLAKLIENSEFDKVDVILEVGSGPGNLTDLLLAQEKPVLSVELDRRFAEKLASAYRENRYFRLLECDILSKGRINPTVAKELASYERWALVSNLPYNVAGNVIVESLYFSPASIFICATVQKEVGLRLSAKPGTKSYGPLSVIVQAVSDVKLIATVPPGAFVPPPKVYSAIVKIEYNEQLASRVGHPESFRNFVHQLFRHRRKTLRSGWIKYLPSDIREKAQNICEKLGIDVSLRAEALSVEQIVRLADEMQS